VPHRRKEEGKGGASCKKKREKGVPTEGKNFDLPNSFRCHHSLFLAGLRLASNVKEGPIPGRGREK